MAASVVAGRVPADLRGTLFRVGPGLFGRGGVQCAHPFDGDGRVDRVSFDGGCVRTASRFVETDAFREEEAAGRLLYRGGFGTAPRASLCRLKNPGAAAFSNNTRRVL